jgi:lipoprotein-anchoring transpeptidase ErfK/SrfK
MTIQNKNKKFFMKRHIGLHYINHPKHLFFTLAFAAGGFLGVTYSIQAYPEIFKTNIQIDKKTNIDLEENLSINFSNPVFENSYSGIKVVRISAQGGQEEKTVLRWENSDRKLTITPKNIWKAEGQYKIILPDGKNKMFLPVPAETFDFSTVSLPKVRDISPANGEKDVVLGIEDPIVVSFEKSAENYSLRVALDPVVSLTYQSDPEKKQFKILPEEKIKEGMEYKITVSVRHIKDPSQNYQEIFKSSFSTKAPPPKNWEKDFTARLEQARKFTKAQITAGKYIDINLSQQILSTFQDGKLLDSYMVSTGKRGLETPKGQFKVLEKRVRPWSKKYALYMPWFMLFTTQGHGIHELPEWPGGYKEGAAHLGTPVSHGCVRLGVGPAKIVYDWADIGTPVVTY